MPAVAVIGVLAHTHLGDDVESRPGLALMVRMAPLHHTVFRPGRGAAGIFGGRQAEEDAVAHAMLHARFHRLIHTVQAVVELSRQALDGTGAGEGLVHKNGIDQTVGTDTGLPAQAAHRFTAAQAAGTLNEFHGTITSGISQMF